MSQTDIHPDNDTPKASESNIKRMDKDTPFHPIPGSPAASGKMPDKPSS